ncbi:MAG TPA: hypothetical protein VLX29_11635, partial [Nitrospirota bacterium]|nr:hypothetical protein [Nitrospirota bacterium]
PDWRKTVESPPYLWTYCLGHRHSELAKLAWGLGHPTSISRSIFVVYSVSLRDRNGLNPSIQALIKRINQDVMMYYIHTGASAY